jgi:hypothetical protein
LPHSVCHPLFRERMLSGGDRRALQGVKQAVSAALADQFAFATLFECLFSAEIVRMRVGDALEKIAHENPQLFNRGNDS